VFFDVSTVSPVDVGREMKRLIAEGIGVISVARHSRLMMIATADGRADGPRLACRRASTELSACMASSYGQ
jgi:hypothetical protein